MTEVTINGSILRLKQGDITLEQVDAIVNAANSRLAGGGGVDGAIHRAGGPAIMAECRKYPGCPAGGAVITGGGNLKAKYVIHAVGPYYSGKPKDAELLASAYRKSLELASEHDIRTISFPAISTGVYRYPLEAAAEISLRTVTDYLNGHKNISEVNFVLFNGEIFSIYSATLNKLKRELS
jgi:O-acetyl-ADP-ribose deacetylase (regulator of RNase III)